MTTLGTATGQPATGQPATGQRSPHDLVCLDTHDGLACFVVPAHGGAPAPIRAEWAALGRVELAVAGRVLAVARDVDGRGVRVTDPFSGMPLAVFRPRRRGRGTVVLADGSSARWIVPDRFSYECGFVTSRDANLVRFADDGSVMVLTGEDDQALVLMILGWFLLWIGVGKGRPAANPTLDDEIPARDDGLTGQDDRDAEQRRRPVRAA